MSRLSLLSTALSSQILLQFPLPVAQALPLPMIFALFAAVSFPNLRLSGPTDADLVDRFQHGDHRAFDEIVRRYQDRVFTLCRRWLDDAQSAEETAQDVFIALYRSLPGFRGESQLSTWVFKVTLNHCKNHRMYRTRRGYRRHESLGPQPDDAPSASCRINRPAPTPRCTAPRQRGSSTRRSRSWMKIIARSCCFATSKICPTTRSPTSLTSLAAP